MDIREWSDFIRVLGTVVGMAMLMILVAYGIFYIFEAGLPLPTQILLFIFAIAFVVSSVFFEKRGAVYPWFLIGGGIASAGVVFITTSSIGGIKYFWLKGFSGLGVDIIYYLSICMILSMILLSLVRYKL